MKVLVACEESQAVCNAFRNVGHEAYSCDVVDCSGGHLGWHIKNDALKIINGNTSFVTCDGVTHRVDMWDLIIAHPPCTRLCASGQRWLHYGSDDYRAKKKLEQIQAIDFFMQMINANCDKIAVENPVGIMSTYYRKPDCIYNPYDFEGETECKKTCLWLKNLPPLVPTQKLPKEKRTHNIWRAVFDGQQYSYADPRVAIFRSKTPEGVAKAMAEQWG